MRWFSLACSLGLLLGCNNAAPDSNQNEVNVGSDQPVDVVASSGTAPEKEPSDEATEDTLEQVRIEYNEAVDAWVADRERQSIDAIPGPEFAERCLKIAEKSPAVEAQAYAFAIELSKPGSAEFHRLVTLMFDRHKDSPAMASVPETLAKRPTEANVARLRWLIENSPERTVRGAAWYGIAKSLVKVRKMRDELGLLEDAEFVEKSAPAFIEFCRTANTDNEQLEEAYRAMMEYSGVKVMDGYYDVGELGERRLFSMQHLQIGCVAPDIEGPDLDGTEFKLSEYRGKVVMLDFWGDW